MANDEKSFYFCQKFEQMKLLDFISKVEYYDSFSELSEENRALVEKAYQSAKDAYSPYSHFKVGVAILLGNGNIVTGNNQENAAYPSGLCAERTAAFYASSQFPDVPFRKIAITSISPNQQGTIPVSPCGSCRQSLLEYEQKFNQKIEVIVASENGKVYIFDSIAQLLPYSFGSANLI